MMSSKKCVQDTHVHTYMHPHASKSFLSNLSLFCSRSLYLVCLFGPLSKHSLTHTQKYLDTGEYAEEEDPVLDPVVAGESVQPDAQADEGEELAGEEAAAEQYDEQYDGAYAEEEQYDDGERETAGYAV
jgi:hypothetical protein